MTGRERFVKALRREPITGHVPHFELVVYLTMEILGKIHPEHRRLHTWKQMSACEKEAQLQDAAFCYIKIAEKYGHSAIFVHTFLDDADANRRLLEIMRERAGNEYFLMMHGDCTHGIPNGDGMSDFTARMYEDAAGLKDESERYMHRQLESAARLSGSGLLDGFALCSDYCFNTNPFYTPAQFGEFIVPYLKGVIDGYRSQGFYSIKHTDGNIIPILDLLLECGPDALHSLDPQGGVDFGRVKKYCGDRVCLIGNVNCGLLQTGTDEEVQSDVLRSLRDGMPGYGYVFSTSNCVYTGLALERYELMHRLWLENGTY